MPAPILNALPAAQTAMLPHQLASYVADEIRERQHPRYDPALRRGYARGGYDGVYVPQTGRTHYYEDLVRQLRESETGPTSGLRGVQLSLRRQSPHWTDNRNATEVAGHHLYGLPTDRSPYWADPEAAPAADARLRGLFSPAPPGTPAPTVEDDATRYRDYLAPDGVLPWDPSRSGAVYRPLYPVLSAQPQHVVTPQLSAEPAPPPRAYVEPAPPPVETAPAPHTPQPEVAPPRTVLPEMPPRVEPPPPASQIGRAHV